jgi:hypothetical protein
MPNVPWAFGPYQQQGYLLSLELHKRGFKVRAPIESSRYCT